MYDLFIRGKPLGDRPVHIDMDPNVTLAHAARYRVPVAELIRVNEELRRLCDEGIIKPVTTHRLAFQNLASRKAQWQT